MNNPDALGIVTAVGRDVQHVDESGFPLEVFPAKMQEILLHWAEHDDYKVEFAAMSMLAAMSAGLGNTYRIRIKGRWNTNAAMYVILVGRPGTGKTPPVEAAMRPLVELDEQRLEKYRVEMEAWQAQTKGKKGEDPAQAATPKPKLVKTIVSDVTPEKMVLVHADNLRGIILHVDELMGLFNSASRYNSSPFIEQLLSVWSGSPLDYSRVGNPVPVLISKPFVSIIGTTQTARIHELLQKGFKENGMLDRFLFVLPKSQKIAKWKVEDLVGNSASQEQSTVMDGKWDKIMRKVFALDYETYTYEGKERRAAHILSMNEEAARVFTEWQNRIAGKNNAIENDCDVETRDTKLPAHLAKLALLLQVARFACGESHLDFIDGTSVRGAIKLLEYLEDSNERVKDAVANLASTDHFSRWLALLPDTFTTADAITAGKKVGMSESNVKRKLSEFWLNGRLHKDRHGKYTKMDKRDKRTEASSEEHQPEPSPGDIQPKGSPEEPQPKPSPVESQSMESHGEPQPEALSGESHPEEL